MARVVCRACGFDQRVEWDGACRCPSCGSSDVRVALAVEDLQPEHLERMLKSLEGDCEGIAAN